MCGIYGSTSLSKFEILENVNRTRGSFATGICYFSKKKKMYDLIKENKEIDWESFKLPDEGYYLGHNQAPTGSERKWSTKTTHPFIEGDWVVAHNGVLTNFKELKNQFLPEHANPVDSSIIPSLLDLTQYSSFYEKESKIIEQVLNYLNGTFALWILNTTSYNTYIARQGSTLFYDKNSFSSIKGEGYKVVEEGIIYKVCTNSLRKCGTFKTESPFLVI